VGQNAATTILVENIFVARRRPFLKRNVGQTTKVGHKGRDTQTKTWHPENRLSNQANYTLSEASYNRFATGCCFIFYGKTTSVSHVLSMTEIHWQVNSLIFLCDLGSGQ